MGKDADNHALALQMRDVTAAYASRDHDEVLEKMKTAHDDKVEGSPQSAVEAMGKVLALTKKDTASLMDGLLATIGQAGYAGQPVTRATMVNAVTAVAHQANADSGRLAEIGQARIDPPIRLATRGDGRQPTLPKVGPAWRGSPVICDSPIVAMVRLTLGEIFMASITLRIQDFEIEADEISADLGSCRDSGRK